MRNNNLQIGTGLKSILLTVVFSLLATTCFTQSIPAGSHYLGQTPPENIPKALPLFVNQGFFAAERIAISNDGRDIYYSEIKGVKSGSGWGNPKRILTRLDKAHYYQVTRNGNHYISSIAGNGAGLNDWCMVIITGADTTAISLGRPLNTGGENLDFFVSRDESYMIVTNRPGLAISYRNNDGSWTNPRNFGPKIDFGLGSWGPWVTPDNKYLFYSTGTKPDYSDVYVYWVRIDGAIDSLKQNNEKE